MPLTLAQMHALIADGGDNTAADVRDVIQALYDWIPNDQKYRMGRLPGETAHADDDFFTAYSGYTEHSPTGTADWDLSNYGLTARFFSQTANDVAVSVKDLTPTSPPVTIETTWSSAIQTLSNPGFGLCFTDGAADASNIAAIGYLSNHGVDQIEGTLASVTPTLTGTGIDRVNFMQGTLAMRLIWKSANTFAWCVSPDGGTTWSDQSAGTFSETFTPDKIGFWVSGWSRPEPSIVSFAYLRVFEADLSV